MIFGLGGVAVGNGAVVSDHGDVLQEVAGSADGSGQIRTSPAQKTKRKNRQNLQVLATLNRIVTLFCYVHLFIALR